MNKISRMLKAAAKTSPIDYEKLARLVEEDKSAAFEYFAENARRILEDALAMRSFYAAGTMNPVRLTEEIQRLRETTELYHDQIIDLQKQVRSRQHRDRKAREKALADAGYKAVRVPKAKLLPSDRIRARYAKQ